MTADPYTADELPGVIAELRRKLDVRPRNWMSCDQHNSMIAQQGVIALAAMPRLLATVEALAADAERLDWLQINVRSLIGPHTDGTAGYSFDNPRIRFGLLRHAIDAARAAGFNNILNHL